ncbi:glycosyltransferase [Pontibacter harenae]|uniref:glycosyltransferase n=1 Tax=Pontibacter harenae TaxID=2894083 RepID=UPI001E520FAF|nr:glycosyltransferase [Pontibacter harenae]MCC9166957.1 glycosyltransferase [Pontibacter harenae]
MATNNLKVCYVIYCEEIWNPLLKRQVLELLQTMAKSDARLNIRLLYIFPWYWKFLKKKKFEAFAAEFDAAPIELKFLPIPFPFPVPYFLPKYIKGLGLRPYEPDSSVFFWVAKVLVLPVLLKYVLVENFNIFHCRSYPASAILLLLKKLQKNIKLVFDPRSDYPEENILQSSWTKDSHAFKYWKKQEKELLQNASVTVCISKFYQQYYQHIYKGFRPHIIPNNVDCSNFKFDAVAREQIRSKFDFQNKIVFCYLGSMGIGGWHCPYIYASIIKDFRKIAQQHIFLFLVPHPSRTQIEKAFQEEGIRGSEYRVISPAYQDVPQYLSAADYGLIYLKREKIALGTKVVEYNAMGLPVLVNSNVISAAGYVKEHKTGLVVDFALGDLDTEKTCLESIDFENKGAEFNREKITQTAVSLFSNEKVASEYLQVYQSLEN